MRKKELITPIIKWAGGKRQLLSELRELLPKRFSLYCEPFVGGGALFFDIQPRVAYINDVNAELITVYRVVRDNVEELIKILSECKNEKDYYYKIRDIDRNKEVFDCMSEVEKAARFIFLNKTCFNGLHRVNSRGEFNVPFGAFKNPCIVNAPLLRRVSVYFRRATIFFTSQDYQSVLETIPDKTFVYLDPPYDPASTTSNFTGYACGGFSRDEQVRLRENCDKLNERGIQFMLSNSATDFILDQYKRYHIRIVQAKRAINSDASKRGFVDEVIVRNYE